MARELRRSAGGAPARLRASRLRVSPAGAQPFNRQVLVLGLVVLATAGVLAALRAGSGPPHETARPGALVAAPLPAEGKLHALPVSASPPEERRAAVPATPPRPASPAPPEPAPSRAASAQVASPQVASPQGAPVQATSSEPAPPQVGVFVPQAPPAIPAERPPAQRSPTTPTLGEAAGRGSVRSDASASTECLPAEFKALLQDVAARFGKVTVVATNGAQTDNHSRGSVRNGLHLSCRAVDFRVEGDIRAVLGYLRTRPEVNGLNSFRTNLIHIDHAERRQARRRPARPGSGPAE